MITENLICHRASIIENVTSFNEKSFGLLSEKLEFSIPLTIENAGCLVKVEEQVPC